MLCNSLIESDANFFEGAELLIPLMAQCLHSAALSQLNNLPLLDFEQAERLLRHMDPHISEQIPDITNNDESRMSEAQEML